MDQQRCPLFWRYLYQTYSILINPHYWFSKVDFVCIINIGFSGAHPLGSSINYFYDTLWVLELSLWRAWLTGGSLGILVCFGCTWRNFGVWLRSLSAWNFPTGTTAPVSTSSSEPFPYNVLSIRVQPIWHCEFWEIINNKPFLFPVSNPTHHPPLQFPLQVPSTAHHPIGTTISHVRSIYLTFF